MGSTTLPDYPRGLTFEKVWAALMEDRERQKETDRQMKENAERLDAQIKETDRQMKENHQQMKESAERLDRQLGKLGNRFGEMVEHMIMPNLLTQFEELGFTFTQANSTKITDKKHNIFTEVDAFLENGEKVMIVEIKTKPSIEDINDHIERMEKLRAYADFRGDRRKYLGAIAGVVLSGSEKTYALRCGFYVLEPSGDTFNITAPEGEYHPREW
jgi:hypothetical protein